MGKGFRIRSATDLLPPDFCSSAATRRRRTPVLSDPRFPPRSARRGRGVDAPLRTPAAGRTGSPEAGMGAAPTPPAGRLPALGGARPTLGAWTPAAGCRASAPSSASWRPWLPVAPSPSSATVCTSTGSGVATPRSGAACGTVSATAAAARPGGRAHGARAPRGARGRREGSRVARAPLYLQKEEPSSRRPRVGAPR